MRMLRGWLTRQKDANQQRTKRRLSFEDLEGRTLLSGTGGDYVLSGTQWPNPAQITYSIAPDGALWDFGASNLNAAFNAKFGNGTWQREIARALATWEDAANINIVPVSESGSWSINAQGQTQSDPRFGDIRFGGDNFNNPQTLAQTYSPPTPGSTDTVSGNVEVNTVMPWNIGSDFDFYSVMLHETGLALGLDEPPPGNGNVVMNTVYGGVRAGLMPGDIAGIQAIYGPRTPDAYQGQGQGLSLSNAVNLNPSLGSSLQATLNNVSLNAVGDTEYFTLVAPSNSGNTLTVTASASNISLLSPKISIVDSSGNVLASQGNAGAWSDSVSAQITNVTPGQRYFIEVTGATNDAFAAGEYQLSATFPHGNPTNTPTNPSSPPSTPTTPAPTSPTGPSHSTPTASQTTSGAVTAVYAEILGRSPGANELTYWNQQFQSGLTTQQFVLDLYFSPEHEADQINALFETELNHPADPGVINIFQTWMQYGATPDNVSRALLASGEFAMKNPGNSGFVNAAFQDLLHRPADATGMTVFTGWLNAGASHDNVVAALMNSGEYRAQEVGAAFNAILNRAVDPSGLAAFTGLLASGQGNINTVYLDLLLSNENLTDVGFLQPASQPGNPPQPAGAQTVNMATLTSAQFASLFQPMGSSPAMASTFQFSSGVAGNVESEVFQGTGAAGGLYAYAYQVDVQGGSGGIQALSWLFNNTPVGTDLTNSGQSTYSYVISGGSIGALSTPQAARGQSVLNPSTIAWQPGSNSATLSVKFGSAIANGGNSATFIILSRQAPAQQFVTLSSSNSNDTNTVLTSVYAPSTGAIGPLS